VAARVPEDVSRGVFCNATMILQSNEEFIIDFLSTMVQPQQIVARVVLTPNTFGQMINAMRENIRLYEERFGRLVSREPTPPTPHPATPHPAGPTTEGHPPAASVPTAGAESSTPRADAPKEEGRREELPRAPAERPPEQPRIEDLYDQLKLPDKILAGAYANLVMIRHLAEEYSFDFVANFYPRPVVTSRVFFPAGRIRRSWMRCPTHCRSTAKRFSGPPPAAS